MSTALRALRVRELRIPFKVAFRHASADRAETSTVWVEAATADDVIGYGESCPRPYVTGETPDSVAAFISAHEPALVNTVTDVSTLAMWMSTHRQEIDRNPAAWCAVELALLDALAGQRGVTVDALLELPPVGGRFRFSAVLGDSSPEMFATQATQYRALGFTDFKIKLSGNLARDRAKVEELRRAESTGLRVRADANNLWRDAESAISFLHQLGGDLFALEEPIGANQYRALAAVAEAIGCRIVLDESLLRAEQIAELPAPSGRWIVNVRVSKMGGLIRSLAVVRAARAAGIGIIVGAQVGETSLLTRAALTVAQAAGADLVAQEGAFGTHLLQRDVCEPPVMFGAGGWLDTGKYDFPTRPGFGLTLLPAPYA